MARTIQYTLMAAILLNFMASGVLNAGTTPSASSDYALLLDYIAIQDRQGPLVAFGESEKQFDQQLNQENLDFLNTQQSLLDGIRERLESDSLSWRLGGSFTQLLVVPEQRLDYADLFEQYCRDAIEFLLTKVQMDNPYDAITTFQEHQEIGSWEKRSGVTAYLVHNIANDYVEEYLFFDHPDDPEQIRIKLSNREFDGRIGSYTSRLKIAEDSRFEFIRESYTLWQNSADLPFNVFIVPIEETLHILLRPFTESAMESQLVASNPTDIDQVQSVIDHWMAVEEAIVGGVVQQIMPELVHLFMADRADRMLAEAMAGRDAHAQYRFLDKGIEVVGKLGVEATMALYRQNPEKFRQMIVTQGPPMASAAEAGHPLSLN